MVVRLTTDAPQGLTFTAQLATPQQDCLLKSEGDEVTLSGLTGSHEKLKNKVRFQGRLHIETKGGKVVSQDGYIHVYHAKEAIAYVSIASNFVNYKDVTANEKARSRWTRPYRRAMLPCGTNT